MSSLIRIRYTPEGASERVWTVDVANPAWDVNTQTEKATGDAWADFFARVMKQSYTAIQVLLWVLRKRDEPRLELASVRFTYGVDLVLEDPDLDPDSPTFEGESTVEDEAPKETA